MYERLYTYMYIYINVYVYIRIHTCIHVCIYVYTFIHVHTNVTEFGRLKISFKMFTNKPKVRKADTERRAGQRKKATILTPQVEETCTDLQVPPSFHHPCMRGRIHAYMSKYYVPILA